MTRERADEIVRKVIYARLNVLPELKNSKDAFHVGRMIGEMQRQLEIELSLEVEPQEEKLPSWLGKRCEDCGNKKCKELGVLPKGYDCALWQAESEG